MSTPFEGYPLSYFAGTEPFASWMRHMSGIGVYPSPCPSESTEEPPSPGEEPPFSDDLDTGLGLGTTSLLNQVGMSIPGGRGASIPGEGPSIPAGKSPSTHGDPGVWRQPSKAKCPAPGWTHTTFLTLCKSRVIMEGKRRLFYEHKVHFSAYQEIAIALPQPKGVVALFGGITKSKRKGHGNQIYDQPDLLRLRFLREPKYGRLIQLEISGDLRFRLPRSLVRPVVEHNHEWVDAPDTHVVAPLGNSKITLTKQLAPRLSSSIFLPPVFVRIRETGIVAKLAKLDFGGTASRPTLRFKQIRLGYLD